MHDFALYKCEVHYEKEFKNCLWFKGKYWNYVRIVSLTCRNCVSN